MTKQALIEAGLTEEQAAKVMKLADSEYVPKGKFDEVSSELAAVQKTVRERDKQLETLKKSAGDNESLKQQIADLQEQNKQQQAAHEAEMKTLKINTAVDMELTKAKAKNNIAVKALMAAFLEKAELSDDGTVKGLDAEIKRLAADKETSFLFDTAAPKLKGAQAGEKGDVPPAGGAMTLDQFRALSPMERHQYSVDHPEEYKAMYGGN